MSGLSKWRFGCFLVTSPRDLFIGELNMPQMHLHRVSDAFGALGALEIFRCHGCEASNTSDSVRQRVQWRAACFH